MLEEHTQENPLDNGWIIEEENNILENVFDKHLSQKARRKIQKYIGMV